MVVAQKSSTLVRGLSTFGRGARVHKNGAWAVKNRRQDKKAAEQATKSVKPAKFYPADDLPKPLPSSKSNHRQTRLRASITPGTVLILLAGRFRGHRVVFLKQMPSGLLLVTGPFKVNGVPLKRVNQAYVIATSTKVDVSSVQIPDTVTDELFAASQTTHTKSAENFDKQEGKKAKKPVPEAFKKIQSQVDAAVSASLSKNKLLKKYLATPFSLGSHDLPHDMKF